MAHSKIRFSIAGHHFLDFCLQDRLLLPWAVGADAAYKEFNGSLFEFLEVIFSWCQLTCCRAAHLLGAAAAQFLADLRELASQYVAACSTRSRYLG